MKFMPEVCQTTTAQRVEACPMCGSPDLLFAFERIGKEFGRCCQCHTSIWMTPEYLPDVYDDGDFILRSEEQVAGGPDHAKFKLYARYLKGDSILEIGPGTGAYLAAARDHGYAVAGVELSEKHRDYMRKRWNIETFATPLESEIPGRDLYDNVVSFNCIEHVINPFDQFIAVYQVLKPGGRFIISTSNSDSLCARLVGKWWSMYKQPDHVNICCAHGLTALAKRTGFEIKSISYGEMPLETPLSVVVSWRDRKREKAMPPKAPGSPIDVHIVGSSGLVRKVGRRLIRAKIFSFVGWFISTLRMGASIKVVFEKPRVR